MEKVSLPPEVVVSLVATEALRVASSLTVKLSSCAVRSVTGVTVIETVWVALSPLAATWRPNDYRVVAGASFRMVLDVGAWDNSRVINTPGQSGAPGSAHYRDLFPKWANGEYVPLSYSRQAVEAATERVVKLRPAS